MEITVTQWTHERAHIVSTRIDGSVDDVSYRRALDDYKQLAMRLKDSQSWMVSLIDLRGSGTTTALQRRMQAEWWRDMEPLTRATTLGVGYVAPSTVMRSLVTAVLWLAPPVVPHNVTKTMSEALSWAFSLVVQHGAALPMSAMNDARRKLGDESVPPLTRAT